MQKIVTFLSYNDQAEEAAKLYTSLFKNASVDSVTPGPDGKPMIVTFTIEGQSYIAMNGGSYFKFENGVSLLVNCETQDEIDHLWDKLSDGGEIQQCGWLKDKFGVTWQIIPTALIRLASDPDRAKAGRVMQAMMQMVKIDIAGLEKAAEG